MDRYKTEDEINTLVREFEKASISRDKWKHAEHLTVALVYLINYDKKTSLTKMRDGIHALLTKGFGVDLSKEMPYHETLTVFWIDTIAEFNAKNPELSLVEKANDLINKYDKDHPLLFYSRELLFSDKARSVWVEPDL
jgi:hypothetical protein